MILMDKQSVVVMYLENWVIGELFANETWLIRAL